MPQLSMEGSDGSRQGEQVTLGRAVEVAMRAKRAKAAFMMAAEGDCKVMLRQVRGEWSGGAGCLEVTRPYLVVCVCSGIELVCGDVFSSIRYVSSCT